MNTPAPLGAHFVRSHSARPIELHQPSVDPGGDCRIIAGRVLGVMFAQGAVHHYRICGEDGVCYLAPPHWLAPAQRDIADWSITKDAAQFETVWRAFQIEPLRVGRLMKEAAGFPPDMPLEECVTRMQSRGAERVMNTRRDFMAFTAGAVVAKTVLPIGARAEGAHLAPPSTHPDAALIAICAEHIVNLRTYNQSPNRLEDFDEDPLWQAYMRTHDIIDDAQPKTLKGMMAKARSAKAEARGLDGSDSPDGTAGAIWAWDLVNDLLAMEQVASA